MNIEQSNHYSMFKRVNDLLTSENEIVVSIPAFKRVADELNEHINEMEKIDSDKVSLTKGKADAKSEVKGSLAAAIDDVAGALFNYACENNLPDLEKTTEYTEAKLFYMPENKLLSVSKAIIGLTVGKETELADQGLTAEEIQNAGSLITRYEAAITALNSGSNSSIASNKSMDTIISEVTVLLNDRADRYAKKKKKTNPDFYNRYDAARRIIDLAATHDTTKADPETGTGEQTNP